MPLADRPALRGYTQMGYPGWVSQSRYTRVGTMVGVQGGYRACVHARYTYCRNDPIRGSSLRPCAPLAHMDGSRQLLPLPRRVCGRGAGRVPGPMVQVRGTRRGSSLININVRKRVPAAGPPSMPIGHAGRRPDCRSSPAARKEGPPVQDAVQCPCAGTGRRAGPGAWYWVYHSLLPCI